MIVSNATVSIDLNALERECDSARAEMGFTRKVLDDAKRMAQRKPSKRSQENWVMAECEHERAVSHYRELTAKLFANC